MAQKRVQALSATALNKRLADLYAPKRGNKIGNKKTVVDGIEFDSIREANRYAELSLLLRAGEISELRRQVTFELIPAQYEPDEVGVRGGVRKGKCIERSLSYVADFVYVNSVGDTVVEDVKGYRDTSSAIYALFVVKRKLMLYKHGIRVKEV